MFFVPIDNFSKQFSLISWVIVIDFSGLIFLRNHIRVQLMVFCHYIRVNTLMVLVWKDIDFTGLFLCKLLWGHVFGNLILGFKCLYEGLEGIVLVDVQVVLLFRRALLRLSGWVVWFQFLYWGLENDQVLQLVAVVNDIRVVDQCVSVDEVDRVIGKWILGEDWFVLTVLGTKLKATGDIVSEMDEFRLVPNPALPVLLEFDLVDYCVVVHLECLHGFYVIQ